MTARVLLTRPSGTWPLLLARFSGTPLVLQFTPTTVQVDPVDPAPADLALRGLSRCDWLVVTSPRGVEALARRLARRIPAGVRIAAVGPATARALEAIGAVPEVVAFEPGSEGLAASLLPRLAPGARVVLVRPEGSPSSLAASLRAALAEVDEAPLYRTIASEQAVELAGSAIAGAFACVVFTAPSSFRLWLEAAGPRRQELFAALSSVRRVAIGATTAGALASAGVPAHEVADEPTEASVGDAIARALKGSTC